MLLNFKRALHTNKDLVLKKPLVWLLLGGLGFILLVQRSSSRGNKPYEQQGHIEEVVLSSGRTWPPTAPVIDEKQQRLDKLVHTFFDVEIKGEPKGRIVFALYDDISPLAAENFRQLCTGEKGVVPLGKEGGGQTYWFKDREFYRIIDKFIDQTGTGTESVYGGKFKDDPGGLKLKHDRPGLLSMANWGPDSNTSHFSIMMNEAPHLNGAYVIFGEVVRGFEIAEEINSYAKGKKDNTAGVEVQAKIVNAGQCMNIECK